MEHWAWHVYGKTAAISFEAEVTRKNQPTVGVHGAVATADGSHDWDNKIQMQLTPRELPRLAAVLLGYASHMEARFHGDSKDKQFKIERQPQNLYVILQQAGLPVRAVPMPFEDAVFVSQLVLRQLARFSGTNPAAVLAAIQGNAELLGHAHNTRGAPTASPFKRTEHL